MKLGEKLYDLRLQAGIKQGLGRALTQVEVVDGVKKIGKTISQSYLSQLEKGTRTHLADSARDALATFYDVHPNSLVDDQVAEPISQLVLRELAGRPKEDKIWIDIAKLLGIIKIWETGENSSTSAPLSSIPPQQALDDYGPSIRSVALATLVQMGEHVPTELLVQALNDSDKGVQNAAMSVLERLGKTPSDLEMKENTSVRAESSLLK